VVGAGEPIHLSNIPRDSKTKPGTIRNLRFNNFLCRGESGAFLFGGPDSPVEDVDFDNSKLRSKKLRPSPAVTTISAPAI
jgi:hypothetical protein